MSSEEEYPCGRTDQKVICSVDVPRLNSIKNIEISNFRIDGGNFGFIYPVTIKDGNKKENAILKVFKVNYSDLISREICNQQIAAGCGVSPLIYDYWFCKEKDKGAIIMEKAGNMTLEHFLDLKSSINIDSEHKLIDALQIVKAIFSLLGLIILLNYKANIFHNDLHLKNILVSVDENGFLTNLKIIDFGESRNFSDTMVLIKNQICDESNIDKVFSNIETSIKSIFADIMMVFSFFVDRYYKQNDEIKQNNGICKLIYDKFILERIYYNFYDSRATMWGMKIEELFNELENFQMEVEEFILDNFTFINEENINKFVIKHTSIPLNIKKIMRSHFN